LGISRRHITVFEHQTLRLNQKIGDCVFDIETLEVLRKYYGEKGVLFYSLIHNGVQFNEHVGVLQVGNTLIEVLPKADKNESNELRWRNILIGMLKAVGGFDVKATSESSLKIKPNTILDLYFELFIIEVEYLLHIGLLKNYRKREGNVTTLKGSIIFGKHIQQNLTHKERFYTNYTTYDVEHQLHFILYKTIRILKQVNTNEDLQSRLGSLLLHFPEMPEIRVDKITFEKLVFSRKNKSYKKAIGFAKIILLQFHPDLIKGRNDVLALMFDMNYLWEQFVYVSLRKNNNSGLTITAQASKAFWKPENGNSSSIRPDIVINKDQENCVVIDTKWKNLNGYNPSPDDLRQMFVYHEFYGAKRVALMYPGISQKSSRGNFYPTVSYDKMDKECSLIMVDVPNNIDARKDLIKLWQDEIGFLFSKWMKTEIN
jgi:5-methylcytosine-specific restriction enzyme subunit McrC